MRTRINADKANHQQFIDIEDLVSKMIGTGEQHWEIQSLLGSLESDVDWLKRELTKFYND